MYEPRFHTWVERDGKLLLIDQTPAGVKFVVIEFGDNVQEATIRQGDIPEEAAGVVETPEVELSVHEGRGRVVFKRCVNCAWETLDVLLHPAP